MSVNFNITINNKSDPDQPVDIKSNVCQPVLPDLSSINPLSHSATVPMRRYVAVKKSTSARPNTTALLYGKKS